MIEPQALINLAGGVILAASTSATQFQVRAGVASGTLTVNGESGARLFGGVLYSSITVTEIEP